MKPVARCVEDSVCPEQMIGNRVVFRTTIEGVKLIATAHTWSNKDVAHALSTIGTTSTCKDPHVSFSPEFGFDGGDTKMHPRAEIVDFLFRNLPTIDNFNKLRQHSLQVEDQWRTAGSSS